jgi:PAS domain S-box-containing protein
MDAVTADNLAAIIESSHDAIIGKTLEGIITTWNNGAEKMFGYAANEMIGKSINVLVPPDHVDEISEILEKIKDDKPIDHFETVKLTKDGKKIDVLISISPIKDNKRKIIGAATIVHDISRLKKTSDDISRLAAIVQSSEDAILGMTLDGKITSWNNKAEKMFGYTATEIMGNSVHVIYPSNRADELPDIVNKIRRGEQVEHLETKRKTKNGDIIDVSLSISPIKNGAGVIVGISKIIRDISDQRRIALYTRSLIEASLDPLVTISPDGKITDVNEATVKVTGVSRERLIGTDFSNYFTEPDEARHGYQQVFKEGYVIDYPLAIRHISGQTTDVLYNATVYKDAQGKVRGVFAAARDVTERKKADQDMMTIEKVKDEFSAMITHELKTPLTSILGYAKMFQQNLFGDLSREQKDAANVIYENSQRLEKLISDILDSRKLEMDKMKFSIENISLQEFLTSVNSSYQKPLKEEEINFNVNFPVGEIMFKADKVRLRQVFDNLISNARKFVPKPNGKIEINAIKNNKMILFSVTDNGTGIPLDKQKELFTKFYQIDTSMTRSAGGTGLGLIICKGVIEKLGGKIWIESDGTSGTTVFFEI